MVTRFSLSNGHEIMRDSDPRGKILTGIKCEKRKKEMKPAPYASLEFCPFCNEVFDPEEISGRFIREKLKIFLENRPNVSREADIIKNIEKALEITELFDIPDHIVEEIINCLDLKPTLRGEKLLSEIGCFGSS